MGTWYLNLLVSESRGGITNNFNKNDDLMTALVVILPSVMFLNALLLLIITTYNDPHMTVTMTVTEM